MIYFIIIFFIAIIWAFGMLVFRAWEIRSNRITIDNEEKKYATELSFRRIEKILLFIAKYTIQGIVLFSVKTWFLISTKTKFWFQNKLPKINKFFTKNNVSDSRKISFIQRAVIESKIKIRRAKEKIKKEHEEKVEEIKEESEVDKII